MAGGKRGSLVVFPRLPHVVSLSLIAISLLGAMALPPSQSWCESRWVVQRNGSRAWRQSCVV